MKISAQAEGRPNEVRRAIIYDHYLGEFALVEEYWQTQVLKDSIR